MTANDDQNCDSGQVSDGKADDFKLPIAPPIQLRGKQETETNLDGGRQIAEDSQAGSGGSVILRKSWECASESSGNSIDSEVKAPILDHLEEVPVETIDDHPVVAVVLILLGILATWFLGIVICPLGIPFLIIVYWIIFDFFKKKKERSLKRMLLKQDGSTKSSH